MCWFIGVKCCDFVVSGGGRGFFKIYPLEGERWSQRLRGMNRNLKRFKLQISICKLTASASALVNEHHVSPIYRTILIWYYSHPPANDTPPLNDTVL
jgi:hypothetical protein